MARAKPKSKSKQSEQSEQFELNPVWTKTGIWCFLIGIAVLLVCYFESVNRQVQIDRRLSRDPRIAEWYASTKHRIDESPPGEGAMLERPVAVWYGKILNCTSSDPKSGAPGELLAVSLTSARLMAGDKGKLDNADKLYISTRNSDVARQSPRVGDEWVFSVWRDDKGNNHTQSAACFRRAGS